MTYAITLDECGGSDVLKTTDIDMPSAGDNEVVVHHEAVGLNFIDVYFRTGLYPIASFPTVIGMEGAGTVSSIGGGVNDFNVGDRVAYAALPTGAYASDRAIRADALVKLPDSISFEQAAAMMLQGMTCLLYTSPSPRDS